LTNINLNFQAHWRTSISAHLPRGSFVETN